MYMAIHTIKYDRKLLLGKYPTPAIAPQMTSATRKFEIVFGGNCPGEISLVGVVDWGGRGTSCPGTHTPHTTHHT